MHDALNEPGNTQALDFLAGGGELGQLMRAQDWAQTPLGPLETWPQSLKTALSICLASPEPVSLLWGPEQTQFYNDAYRAIIGNRHPTILGRPVRANWPEARAGLEPIIDDIMRGDPAVVTDDLPLLPDAANDGRRRSFTHTFSAVRDERGAVGGIFHRVTEARLPVPAPAVPDEPAEHLDLVFEAANAAAFELHLRQGTLRHSPRLNMLFGFPPEQATTLADFRARYHPDDRAMLSDMLPRLRQGAPHIHRDLRIILPDGTIRWIHTRGRGVPNAAGQPEWVRGISIDITARKQMEEELRAAKVYAESIIDTLHEPLLVLTPDLQIKSTNAAFYTHFAVRPEETVGRRIYDLGNGQWNIPRLRTLLDEVLPDNQVFTDYEVEHVFETLGRRVMLLNARRLDAVQLILLGIRDITAHKRAEQALQESEARYRTLAANLPNIAAFMVDHDLRYQLAAGQALSTVGLSPADFEGKTLYAAVPPALVRDLEPYYRQVLAGTAFQHEHSQDGQQYVSHGVPLTDQADQIYAALVISYDITARKQAEEVLRASEARFRTIADLVPDLLWSSDSEGFTHWYNRRWLDYTGQPFEAATDHGWLAVIHPDDRETALRTFQQTVAAGVPLRQEHRIRGADGTYRWFLAQALPLRDEQGRITQWYGAATDIHTQRLALETARAAQADAEAARAALARVNAELEDRVATRTADLVRINQTLEALITVAPPAIITLDHDGRVQRWNPAAAHLFGWSAEEVLGHRLPTLPPDTPPTEAAEQRALQGADIREGSETQRCRKDGTLVEVNLWTTPLYDAAGRIYAALALLTDITTRKQAERQVQQLTNRLRHLHAIDQALLAARSAEEIADAALAHVQDLLPCQYAGVAIFAHHGETAIIHSRSFTSVAPLNEELPLAPFVSPDNPAHGPSPILTADAVTSTRSPLEQHLQTAGMQTILSLPLVAREQTPGMLVFGATMADAFTEEQMGVAQEIADQLTIALQQVQLFGQVQRGQERLAALSRRLLEVQEQERRAIARELHDEIGQIMTGLQLQIGMIQSGAGADQAGQFATLNSTLSELIQRVDGMSLNLRPSVLDNMGVLPALLRHIDRYTRQTNIQVDFLHTDLDQRFPSEIETVVYRVVQEALTNVARYAGVSQVLVQVQVAAQTIIIEVIDEGPGFDLQQVLAAGTSSGVSGMYERVGLVGGQLFFDTAPGNGTTIVAEIPLPEL